MSFAAETTDLASSRPRFVVDASVAVKWYLRDEPDTEFADRVLDDFQRGHTSLFAPNQIRYEVPSAIRNALRARRLLPAPGRLSIADFLALRIATVDDDTLIEAGYDQALQFDCSLYDGLYLSLAETLVCPFVYADKRLRNALGTRFPLAIWLADYVSIG